MFLFGGFFEERAQDSKMAKQQRPGSGMTDILGLKLARQNFNRDGDVMRYRTCITNNKMFGTLW